MTTKTFIDRPLLSAVISIFIIALGVIALLTLPEERYPDINVQNRVIQAQAQLPQEVLQLGISTEKQQPGQLRIIALESPGATFDENFLSNYFYNNLRPQILRINGVGKVEVWGAQYALRVWLKPEMMARHWR